MPLASRTMVPKVICSFVILWYSKNRSVGPELIGDNLSLSVVGVGGGWTVLGILVPALVPDPAPSMGSGW